MILLVFCILVEKKERYMYKERLIFSAEQKHSIYFLD